MSETATLQREFVGITDEALDSLRKRRVVNVRRAR